MSTSERGGSSDPALDALLDAPRAAIGALILGVEERVREAMKPAAVAAVATTFTFPIALMAVVLLFLLVQGRLDGRDPKFRSAPLTSADTMVDFTDEDTD